MKVLRDRRQSGLSGWALVLILVIFGLIPARTLHSQRGREFGVRYRSAGTVYLDAGSLDGLAVGDRLEVIRDRETIARIEVIFVAEHSASCRVLEESTPVETGDRARREAGAGEDIEASEEATAAAPTPEAEDGSAESVSSGTPDRGEESRPAAKRPATRVRGSLSFDWEDFSDDTEGGSDFQRTAAYLNLRVQDIGGRPYEFRLRLRRRELSRSPGQGSSLARSETRDRIYEVSLAYDPPDGRFGYLAGRLTAAPFTGLGYLDGVIGRFEISPLVEIGAFAGLRADVEDLSFSSSRPKYGLFTRLSSRSEESFSPWEVVVSGSREEGEDGVSREYLGLQSRYSGGGNWSFYQSAEIDLNNGWRGELSDSSVQLSNLYLSTSYRFSERARLTLSYDRFERYRTEETRSIEQELFDDLLRQGLRLNLRFGSPRGLNFTLTGALRERDDDRDGTRSYGFGIRHPDVASWGLSLGADVLGYSNHFTDGVLVVLRAAKRIGDGHRIDLSLGSRTSQYRQFDQADTTTNWVRLGGWVELPANLYLNGEYEITTGDEAEGKRLIVGVGYRF